MALIARAVERVVAAAGRGVKVCGRCGVSYDLEAWERLESCGVVEQDVVEAAVSAWPPDVRIVLRRCRCGAVLARKERANGTDQAGLC